MVHDKQLTIYTAGSRRAKRWQPSRLWWSELVERLRTPIRGTETLDHYLKLSRSKQDELKDVGGFVGGQLADGRRKAGHVLGRDIVTLDLDNIPAGGTDDVLRRLTGLACAYAVYSTRKHCAAGPRLRVLIPLSRTCTADEYEPIARKLADIIGIDLCDPSTFEASRLMYWPSCCSDSQYVYTYNDAPLVDTDGVLGMYTDWRVVSAWPVVPGTDKARERLVAKQADPLEKKGVVGAFCRTYTITQVMDIYLPGVYEPCDTSEDRYTYTAGSTTGGAILYDDDKFLFSHHATDPCGGQLVNAFDLVRLHLYGSLDDDATPGTPVNRMPSYIEMTKRAGEDEAVRLSLMRERYGSVQDAFGETQEAPEDDHWMAELAPGPNNTTANTIDNVMVILEHDPKLAGKIALNEFMGRPMALGELPWDKRGFVRQWSDTDDAGVQWYLEKAYGIVGKERILNAVDIHMEQHKYDEVRDYLEGLTWDGKPRLDTLLTDYLGAEDGPYTRAVMRKSLTAAVARAMAPGTKYDYMPILTGAQGIGKSTFFKRLGGKWFSDSLQTFDGKEAAELIQGTWINELGELNGMSRAEINAVKQFLSRTDDIYRAAYGRRTDKYPRRCVFFGTTNDAEFLRDRTGNRRFWPVKVGVQEPKKDVFKDLVQSEVDQIWAEALMRWRIGEPLYLTGEVLEISRQQQEEHRESDAREGMIREFLERPVPVDWGKRSLTMRRAYWSGGFETEDVQTEPRTKVCAIEVWCECLDGDRRYFRKSDTREINAILDGLPDWEKDRTRQYFGAGYGRQRGYKFTGHSQSEAAKYGTFSRDKQDN